MVLGDVGACHTKEVDWGQRPSSLVCTHLSTALPQLRGASVEPSTSGGPNCFKKKKKVEQSHLP